MRLQSSADICEISFTQEIGSYLRYFLADFANFHSQLLAYGRKILYNIQVGNFDCIIKRCIMATEIRRLRYENDEGNELYIMRDDLLPFSMGGNKVRIAYAFLEDMEKKGCDSMIIYGSRHSNLCRVLSDLCFSKGISCTMICSHEAQEDTAPTNNTHLIDWTHTKIVHCEKTQIAQTVERVMEELCADGKKPYYIYGDKYGRGNEGAAAAAYANAYGEITEFERAQGWEFDYIFCPSGTGATQSGLICGHLLAKDKKKIIGVMISSRETDRAFSVIAGGVRDYFMKAGCSLPEYFEQEILLLDEYRAGGYGVYDDEIRSCIREEYTKNGIPFDPVYTGKALLGMKKYIKAQGIEHCRILFLHTGGAPLFYDFLAKEGAVSLEC